MRIVAIVALIMLLGFIGTEIGKFRGQGIANETKLADVRAQFEQASEELGRLREDLRYLEHPENLEKELRERFNYRGEGEKMIIVVPSASSAAGQ